MTRSSVTVLESFRGPRAGSHRLVFTHTLAGTRHERDTTSPVSHTERIELEFSVDAPRLGLARPNDVRSVYPAAGARTDHTKTLPHIVLQTRSFPWAREVSPGLVQDLPWVALLVLRGEELAQVQFRELSGAELAAGNPGTWSPHAAAAPDLALTAREREASVQVMELPEALLRSIAPARRDLGLLAHIRRVSLLAKADGESAETADYATVLANRHPAGGRNLAVLVSLEGWLERLEGPDHPEERARVLVLHRWEFHSVEGKGSFSERLADKKLAPRMLAPEVVLADAAAQAELSSGKLPVVWQLDSGERTVAWCRGPLAPRPVAEFRSDSEIFTRAERAIMIDPGTGMMDVSYALAWQLGQLLALSNAGVARATDRWTHTRRYNAAMGAKVRESILHEMEAWLDSHSTLESRQGELAGDIGAWCAWLTDLALLKPVPLEYLLPGGLLLPHESVRFFNLDPRWLLAAVEGALSLDHGKPPVIRRSGLRRVLGRLLVWHRQERALRGVVREAKETPVDADTLEIGAQGGFLIRSDLLAAYPGIEIQALDTNDAPLEILRLDRLAEGVLFGLVAAFPATLVLKEPQEGLRFRLDQAKPRTPAAPGVIDIRGLAGETARSTDFATQSLFPQEVVRLRLR